LQAVFKPAWTFTA